MNIIHAIVVKSRRGSEAKIEANHTLTELEVCQASGFLPGKKEEVKVKKIYFGCWLGSPTLKDVEADGGLHRVGRDTLVDARVFGGGSLDQQLTGGDLALLNDHTHATPGRVVRYDLHEEWQS